MMAGSLAYVSLLSLVPLVTVVFSLFAAFPMFGEVSEQLKHFILPISFPLLAMSCSLISNSLSLTPAR